MTRDGTRAVREFPLDGLAENPEFLSDSPVAATSRRCTRSRRRWKMSSFR